MDKAYNGFVYWVLPPLPFSRLKKYLFPAAVRIQHEARATQNDTTGATTRLPLDLNSPLNMQKCPLPAYCVFHHNMLGLPQEASFVPANSMSPHLSAFKPIFETPQEDESEGKTFCTSARN